MQNAHHGNPGFNERHSAVKIFKGSVFLYINQFLENFLNRHSTSAQLPVRLELAK